MSTLWLHSRQDIRDRPITTADLRRLAADGGLKPSDLVHRVGTDRWVPAGKIEGLFNAGHAEWYFTHDGRTFGPVSLQQLWDAAGQGFLTPKDYVIKLGMNRWKTAGKIVGLFPEPEGHAPVRPTRNQSVTPRPESRMPAASSLEQVLRRPEAPVGFYVAAPPGEHSGTDRPPPPAARGFAPAMYLAQRIPSLLATLAFLCLAVVGSVWSLQSARTPVSRIRDDLPPRRSRPDSRPTVEVTTADLESEPVPSLEDAHANPVRARLARLDLRPEPRANSPRRPRDPEEDGEDSLPLALVGSSRRSEPPAPGEPGMSLSIATERRMGQAMHNRLLREHPVLETDGLREQVERILRPLRANCRRTEIDYSVTVLDAPEVFAFSHLGGYVYLSRGMIELAATEEGLQFVIAHELAHLELQHGWPLLSRLIGESRLRGRNEASLVPTLLQVSAEHDEAGDELAADAWAVATLIQRGLSAPQCLAFPRRYLAYLRQHADDPRMPPNATGSVPSPQAYDRHRNRAPATIERLQRLPSLVSQGLPDQVPPTLSARPSAPE